mmetsp:Transcript_22805/g.44291  ORF Transcript_22805/g.44291 Transcript_22805/m.44291 type:complete len:421 (+) Transcript_22805:226-1488(+)
MNQWDEPGAEGATSEDLYDVLGVSRDATEAQIKRAYHKAAMIHHPDKRINNPEGSDQKFKTLGYAYNILSDPEKRQMYDVGGLDQVEQQEGMANMNVDTLLLNVLMWENGQKLCFLCALFLFLLEALVLPLLAALRLDGSLEWSWYGVVAPLWIPMALTIPVFCMAPGQISSAYKQAGEDPAKLMQTRATVAGCVCLGLVLGCVAGTMGMLCGRLDGDKSVTYMHALVPVLVIEGLTALAVLGGPPRQALGALGWKGLRVAFVVLVALKLDGGADSITWGVALSPLVAWSCLSLGLLLRDYRQHRHLKLMGRKGGATLEEEASAYAPFFFALRICLIAGVLLSVLLVSLRLDMSLTSISWVVCVLPMLLSLMGAYGMVVWGLLCFKPHGLGDTEYEYVPGQDSGETYGTFGDKGGDANYP